MSRAVAAGLPKPTSAANRPPSPQRPLPDQSEADTGAFWTASKDHQLTYQACGACGEIIFHPRRHCTNCLSTDLQ